MKYVIIPILRAILLIGIFIIWYPIILIERLAMIIWNGDDKWWDELGDEGLVVEVHFDLEHPIKKNGISAAIEYITNINSRLV